MIQITHNLYCDSCGKQHKGHFDDINDLNFYSEKDGWVIRKVQNGSLWNFCPKCDFEKQRKNTDTEV